MAVVLQASETNVDVNRRVLSAEGQTALHIAAFENDPDMIRFLLQHGADITLRDDGGQTALEIARRYKHAGVIRLLEESSSYKPA